MLLNVKKVFKHVDTKIEKKKNEIKMITSVTKIIKLYIFNIAYIYILLRLSKVFTKLYNNLNVFPYTIYSYTIILHSEIKSLNGIEKSPSVQQLLRLFYLTVDEGKE